MFTYFSILFGDKSVLCLPYVVLLSLLVCFSGGYLPITDYALDCNKKGECQMGNTLYYAGVAAMALAVILGAVGFFVLRAKEKRLSQTLDEEYGTQKK